MRMAKPIGRGRWILAPMVLIFFSTAPAWGYYFDERREMSLSGFAYTRGTWALANDDIGNYKGLWQRGNLVQHRHGQLAARATNQSLADQPPVAP